MGLRPCFHNGVAVLLASVPKNGTDLYLKSLPAWREEAKSGDEEVKYGHRTRT